jgi:hypothetical protein
MLKIGPEICIAAGCLSCAGGGSESDMLEGVDIIDMGALTDKGVVGGVGGGEYKGGGVGGQGSEMGMME